MSADESDDAGGESQPYLGTRMGGAPMRTNAYATGQTNVNAALPVRSYDSQPDRVSLGMWSQYDQPTIWDAVNYPREEQFQFESFYLRYERQSEAQAIIDKPVNDTWQSMPAVHDEAHQDVDEPQSEFEREVRSFFVGEHTRRKPIHRLNVLHRLARLGRYAILVLGFADGRPLDTPVAGVSDERIDSGDIDPEDETMQIPDSITDPEFEGLDDLMYLAVFGEDRVQDMDIENDMTSERFRLPSEFEVITQEREDDADPDAEFQQENIHWTRVIHVPEGTLENDLEGIPALKSVFHELLNIDKIKAASGEGFWRAGYAGLHVQPPRDERGNFMEFEDGGKGVQNEIDEFLNNMDRMLSTPAEIDSIDSNIHNPIPHLEANYQSISAAKDIPKSILTGEDRADTGASEDVRQWHQKIGQIRNNLASPVILEPLIQRLIDTGILPQPEGDGFVIEWKPLDEMSEVEEADLKNTISETINNLSGGDPTIFGTVPELRQAIGWDPNMGGEVDDHELDADEQSTEADLEVDEDSLPDQSRDEYSYPDELYDRPRDAEQRAEELGLEATYHVVRIEGETKYAPATSDTELGAALDDEDEEEDVLGDVEQNTEAPMVAANAVDTDGGIEPNPVGGGAFVKVSATERDDTIRVESASYDEDEFFVTVHAVDGGTLDHHAFSNFEQFIHEPSGVVGPFKAGSNQQALDVEVSDPDAAYIATVRANADGSPGRFAVERSEAGEPPALVFDVTVGSVL